MRKMGTIGIGECVIIYIVVQVRRNYASMG
jgi:hypothetical protein